jgi:hypothetical protein
MVLSQIARDALSWVSDVLRMPDDIDYDHEWAFYAHRFDPVWEELVPIFHTHDDTFYVVVEFQDMTDDVERLLLRVYERDGPRRVEIPDVVLRESDIDAALDTLFATHRAWQDAKRPVRRTKLQPVRN